MPHFSNRQLYEQDIFKKFIKSFDSSVSVINEKISAEISKILQALEKKQSPSNMSMSVILEEQTQRSNAGEQFDDTDQGRLYEEITIQCDMNISKLKNTQLKLDKLLNIYADEMYSLCQQICSWQQKNNEINKKYEKVKDKYSKILAQNQELKDQITTISSQYFALNKPGNKSEDQYEQLFKNQEKQHKKHTKNTTKVRISSKNDNNTQIQPTSAAIALPPKKSSIIPEKNTKNNDTMKWKDLSNKINQLKSKLIIYEQELSEKNQIITNLTTKFNEKIKVLQQDDEKKKLKKSNTTLRGEKTVLNNQIASLKRSLNDKLQICEIQQKQLNQHQSQTNSLNETIKFQNQLLEQLRRTVNQRKQDKSQTHAQNQENIKKLEKLSNTFFQFVCYQQQSLLNTRNKIDQIQNIYQLKITDLNQNITDLQSILEQKNQFIVAIKSKDKQGKVYDSSYYSDLIKNLTKKITQKDEIIRMLRIQ